MSTVIGRVDLANEDIGRLYIERRAARHRIIDIALLPAYRGQGAGGALLRDLMDEATGHTRSVSIRLGKLSPAMTLYRRLGFVLEEYKGVYDLMRWTPPHRDAARPACRDER